MLMLPIRKPLAVLALCAAALPALAQTTVENAWARASVANQHSSGAFMTLTSDTDAKLVAVQSPVAKDVQIHEMKMNGDVMTMGPVSSLDLPAGKAVSLDANGYHVMLMGLAHQLKQGQEVPLTLVIEDAKGNKENLEIKAPVRSLTEGEPEMKHGHVHQ
ncbi:copper chaperone PCu(A)C [Pseudomonas bharatica]|uniref:copper chaperone PCu(A)C n=1 Tax=Pseudomonas TaxID=286 RepID=UPI003B283117